MRNLSVFLFALQIFLCFGMIYWKGENNMKNSFRLLSTGLVLAVLGVILTVFVVGDMIDNAQKPADYSTLEMEDYKPGMIVEGDLPYNYGNYESVTKEGSTTSIGDYYMIEAGSDGFMGIYTAKKDLMKELYNQYNEFNSLDTLDARTR